MDAPLYIWRTPTVDEIVRSFSIHNVNAGCTWDGYIGMFNCQKSLDKKTLLWGHLMNHQYNCLASDEF